MTRDSFKPEDLSPTQAEEVEHRAWELLEAECGKPLPFDVPTSAALSALRAALLQQPAMDGCHCGTCTCNPNMTPAVRFDLSPAQQEGAIREHLIRLGWTPPVGAAEDMVLDAIERRESSATAAVDEAAVKRAVAAVMSAPPGISVEAYVRIVLEAALPQQPAPVGVKTLSEFMAEQEELHPGIHNKVQAAADELRTSLAQQPVVVDAPGSRTWMAEVCRAAALSLAAHGVRNDQLSKVADWIDRQPAAAHEPCAAVAAIQFALTDPEGMTFLRLWNEGEFDTLRREWPDALRKVYDGADPLAQQRGEVT